MSLLCVFCLLHSSLPLTPYFRPTSTLWCTWLRTTRPSIASRHLSTFSCSQLSSLLTLCQYNLNYVFLVTGSDSNLLVSWDTSMSQKSRFKMQTQGIHTFRNTFPQLPWGTLKNPTFIQTAHGCVIGSYASWHFQYLICAPVTVF